MSQITVISGPERRRVWSEEQKRQLVAAIAAPGANVAEIARRADVRPNQIYRWRQQMEQAAQGFAEVQVQADPVPVIGPAITVEFDRAIVRIPAGASAVLVSAVLRSIKP
jgi:transposase